MTIKFRTTRIALVSLLAATCLSGGAAMSQEGIYQFWPKREPLLMSSGGHSAKQHDPIEIMLSAESPFNLTVGQSISLGMTVEGDTDGVTYRVAAPIPGLSVNPTSGSIDGIPDAPAGTAYSIAVEAVRDGSVIGTTNVLFKTLRAPLAIDNGPDDVDLTVGEPFPSSGLAVSAVGGDQDSITWSLENAPSWLSVTSYDPAVAVLQQTPGVEIAETPATTVTVVASDAEGRQASKAFNVKVSPAEEFDPGPLKVGGVNFGGGVGTISVPEGSQPLMFGILASGGVPPYTLSFSGATASVPARIFYRSENFAPDLPIINVGGTPPCGSGPQDLLCLFRENNGSGYAANFPANPETGPDYYGDHSFRYAEVISSCDTDISGSRSLTEIFSHRLASLTDSGETFRAAGVSIAGRHLWCGGYDDKSILAAVELDLAPYVTASPGDRDYVFTVTDAEGHSASTSATIRIHSIPITLASNSAHLDVGKSYTAANKLIDPKGGFGALSIDYADGVRVPGMEIVNGHLTGSPTDAGNWTLSLAIQDHGGQSVVLPVEVSVQIDCGAPVVFSTAGTFNYSAPNGCLTISAQAWGGGANGLNATGGPGGAGIGNNGSGGGGGAYASSTFDVSAPSYQVTVGSAGTDSSVKDGAAVIVLAKAGSGSNGGSKFQSIGDATENGSKGGGGDIANPGNGGKGGGSGGGEGGTFAHAAQAPGGGGIGGTSPNGVGGAGAFGRVIIQAMP